MQPASSPLPPLHNSSTIIIDGIDQNGDLASFRTCQYPTYNVNPTGLAELQISGSAQPTKQGFETIIAKVAQIGQFTLFFVDTRQEPHGYIDKKEPISWYAEKNWICYGMNASEAAAYESKVISDLASKKSEDIEIVRKLKEDGNIDHDYSFKAKVKTDEVFDELTMAKSLKVGYLRLYVTDHLFPTDDQVDVFLQFVKTLPPEAWLHFHCEHGDGRTTTLMAMFDMIRNAGKDVTFEDFLARQASLGGENLADLTSSDSWKIPLKEARYDFLYLFYLFINDCPGLDRSFSEWKRMASPHLQQVLNSLLSRLGKKLSQIF